MNGLRGAYESPPIHIHPRLFRRARRYALSLHVAQHRMERDTRRGDFDFSRVIHQFKTQVNYERTQTHRRTSFQVPVRRHPSEQLPQRRLQVLHARVGRSPRSGRQTCDDSRRAQAARVAKISGTIVN